MWQARIEAVIGAVAETVTCNATYLDMLDAAIGDGDHGSNLARACERIRARSAEIAALSPPEGLRLMAAELRDAAGGDGGRLYAALLEGMAHHADEALHPKGLARMIEAGVATMQEEGAARRGDKTVLDVLVPVVDALVRKAREGGSGEAGARAIAAAAHGLHMTTRLVPRRGLAADLGSAGTGHMDPGALSAALIVGAVVGALEPPRP